jgi:two-component system cell cycle response regulator CpdR
MRGAVLDGTDRLTEIKPNEGDPILGYQRAGAVTARILLAEDDDQLRTFLARGLQRAGYEVDAVGDGSTALELAQTINFDLLLADVVMPGLDGIELARQVSARQPGIRVMFITGFAAVTYQEEPVRANRPRVLAKPFHLRHLISEVEALLLE